MNQGKLNFEPSATTYATRSLSDLPSFAGIDRVSIDTETDLQPVSRRKLYGISYRTPDGRQGYVSVRHPRSVNYDEGQVQRWLSHELCGKIIICANAKHEVEVLRNFGVDLEGIGCRMRDVFYQAALLNDHRYSLNLDGIAREELGRGKIELINTEEYPIHERPADEVAAYGIEDSLLAYELNDVYQNRIFEEGLTDVLDLEDALVYATCEMERNGAYIDVETLIGWRREIQKEFQDRILKIYRDTGLRVNPNSGDDMARLFHQLGLRSLYTTDTGKQSFTEEALLNIEHPVARLALEARQLSSLDSKYVSKYIKGVESDGRLRYQLHQLRGDEFGCITGRYSSSKVNIQQVQVRDKQPKLLQRWPIRQLFIPPKGRVWASADASQIEFRIFAHYASALGVGQRLADAYRANPKTDFHSLVVEWTGLIRALAKNVSFCKLYGGGTLKVALMCNLSDDEARALVNKYDREFPEARSLLARASQQAETVGYVRTFLGRRRRYRPGDKFYSALNSVFQGTAADIMKQKILELYRERKRLGLTLRFTVHDEVDGDIADDASMPAVQELLNRQTTPFEVPILWDASTGANWQEAHQ